MKKLFYYTVWDFTNAESNGICKKIMTQIEVFEQYGYSVDYSFVRDGNTYVRQDGKIKKIASYNPIWNKLFANRKIASYIKKNSYDYIYCRYACSDWFFIQFLRNCHKSRNRIKVVVEIPTYPYDAEISEGIIDRVFIAIDKLHRNSMKKFVGRIATFTKDNEIFGIPTIQIINGLDFKQIPVSDFSHNKNSINIIAVASIAKWHGYDRVIEGMGRYYQNGGMCDIRFHIVGDGDLETLDFLKKLVERWKLSSHVIFYGSKHGKELDGIYEKCDLAAECFGLHRKNLACSSSLKSREYCAKGLPIFAANNIDIFEQHPSPFFLKFNADDTPINMEEVIAFYDSVYGKKTKKQVVQEIRQYAEKICSIAVTMQPIRNYFESIG